MRPRYSLLMLTHERTEILASTLESLLNTIKREDVQTVIFDNGSRDQNMGAVLNHVRAHVPGVRVIMSHENLGVAAGRNLLLKEARADYCVFLDADVAIVHDNWIDVMGAVLDKDRRVGLVGAGGSMLAGDWSRFFPGFPGQVDSVAGYCQMFRRSLITERGLLLDERFSPFWAEDADFCFQVRSLGLDVVCVALGVLHLTEHGRVITDDPVLNAHMDLLREKWRGKRVVRLEGAY